ncbi:MAG: cytochrome c biogenesis CcdA family protein [Polynucleobacter sp.]|nr:cytochrome c biogenesis CcdA family protein [Polynucleobacter sp.]MDZ4055651.1 cytochrome c biogenesis CcdA family protein [Polynucleobacter sp.]
MDFGIGSFLFAFLAGVLSTLSPCVLPLIPIIIGAAANQHRLGPFALAGGLTISFAVIGTALASLGSSIGLAQDGFRLFAAIVMGAIGIVLISSKLQERFAVAMSGVSGAGNSLLSKVTIDGLFGQFLIGILLGLVWTPCVGPTLGAAITLASQGKDLGKIVFVMAIFGLGAGLPLALLGVLSRGAMMKAKGKLGNAGKFGKQLLGGFLILISLLVITGQDKPLEAFLLKHSPAWLTDLTTTF